MAKISMKRWPTLLSFMLFVVLCASLAWWAMQLFKPPLRAVAAPPLAQTSAPSIEAAASLFGGRGGTEASASNYQLKGLVLASTLKDSIVILSADGKPTQAYRASKDIAPGVSVKEVHPGYIVLAENGALRRIELPAELKNSDAGVGSPPVRTSAPPARTMPSMPSAPHTAGARATDATQDNTGALGSAPARQPTVVISAPNSSSGQQGTAGAGAVPQTPAAAQPPGNSATAPPVTPAPTPPSSGTPATPPGSAPVQPATSGAFAPAPVQPGQPQPVPSQ